MSSSLTPRPIPYRKLGGDNNPNIHFFNEEFIDRFPNSNPWIIHGLAQMQELYQCDMASSVHPRIYKEEYDAACIATVALMSNEMIEWAASQCHPNTPYGELFYTEAANRLLIGYEQV